MSAFERTDLLRYATEVSRGMQMISANKMKLKQNLLEMSNSERTNLFGEVKEKLRKKISEAKFWQLLLEVDCLSINDNVVYAEDQRLHGFYLRNKI